MMTFPATPLFHKSNTENQMVNNTGFYLQKYNVQLLVLEDHTLI